MNRLLLSISVALMVTMVSASAFAKPPTYKERLEARKYAREGKVHVRKGEHKKAAKKFRKADKLVPAPSYKLQVSKALVELEDFVQASEILAECMDQGPIRQWQEKAAQKKCTQLASEVDDRMPRIAVVIGRPSTEEVIVMVNGEDYDPAEGEVGFNPGKYTITAEAEGYESFKKKITLKEKDRETIEVSLKGGKKKKEEEEEDEDSGGLSPIPAYIAWGTGGVGLALGIGFGIAAIQTTNQILNEYGCDRGECPPEAEADLSISKTNGNVSTAGFIIAGVGLAGGTILYLLADTGDDDDDDDDDEDEEEDEDGMLEIEARPLIGPAYFGVQGTF